ncbi:InlB B-repeat-containing protein [Sporosarcina sp. G11-34]|uniref:InlB B-repeat-containing protein n=1 Tax=Sporosarcina sp. G11-34 TaxID=2849605 RepID=UPI0022A9AB0D|nr:InlB B-repeat-containing protein [Sporosarcina sp. G11-34]MCZ2258651.1 InlB B-repeat-containing protein [Sporosarcina sp. G11-34]
MKSIVSKVIVFILFFLFINQVPLQGGTIFSENLVKAEGLTKEYNYLTEVPNGYIGIESIEDLNKVRSGLGAKYILMNDIDLTKETSVDGWIPIGNRDKPFTGVFDGNGYKIIGMNINIISDQIVYAGLFGYISKAEIKGLGIVESTILVENNSIYSTTSDVYVGGITGYVNQTSIIVDSYTTGSILASSLFNSYAGGLVGAAGQVSVIDSYNEGDVSAKEAGGIAGKITSKLSKVGDSYNTGKITGSNYAGGITGTFYGEEIRASFNEGTISSSQGHAAGIAGYISSTIIKETRNEADVTGYYTSGGIVGRAISSTIEQSANTGEIKVESSLGAGGIAGGAQSSIILYSSNSGDIYSKGTAGGISGGLTNTTIAQCVNEGAVVASGSKAGGVVGDANIGSVVDNCYNLGSVSAKFTVGGIVGDNAGVIKNVYNVGNNKEGSSITAGGIAGKNTGNITTSYYLDAIKRGVGNGNLEGVNKKTFDEMKNKSTFKNFDFQSTWLSGENEGYEFPVLRDLKVPSIEKDVAIHWEKKPEKLEYLVGEPLDLTGAIIRMQTNLGREYGVEITEDMVGRYYPNNLGSQSIKITIGDVSTYFTVRVLAKYTVVFIDDNGLVLKTEEVIDGDSASAPEIPYREGHDFIKWSRDFQSVRSDLTVGAIYEPHTYSVIFEDDGVVLSRQTVTHGRWATAPKAPTKTGYKFTGWDNDYKNITSDITISSTYQLNEYTVEFRDYDRQILERQLVPHGSVAKNPENLNMLGYKFIGWYSDAGLRRKVNLETEVNKNLVLYAKFEGQQVYLHELDIVSTAYNKLKVSWAEHKGVSGYEVYRATSSNGTYKLVETKNVASSTTHVSSGLITGKTYYYEVKPYGIIDGKKVYSRSPGKTTLYAKPIPAKPTGVKTTNSSSTAINVSWKKVAGASGYEVHRATSKSGKYNRVNTVTNGSTLSYTNNDLTTGKSYYYKVRSYRTMNGKKVYGSYSSIVSGKPALAKPTGVTATKMNSKSIKVSWKKVNGASGFQVYQATSKNGKYKNVKTVTKGSTVSYTNKNLKPRQGYYYKVRAYRTVSGKKVYSPFSLVKYCKI